LGTVLRWGFSSVAGAVAHDLRLAAGVVVVVGRFKCQRAFVAMGIAQAVSTWVVAPDRLGTRLP
jgi:hypothetical protein